MSKLDGKLRIGVDCNCNYFGPDKPTISLFEIEYFKLKEGDEIIGYQDEQEWEGIIKFDSSCPAGVQWYLQLDLNKEYNVSEEKAKGREEGARSAFPIGEISGEIAVVTKMLSDGMNISIVSKYTRLPLSKLKAIKDSL